jgi:hypothetical protein
MGHIHTCAICSHHWECVVDDDPTPLDRCFKMGDDERDGDGNVTQSHVPAPEYCERTLQRELTPADLAKVTG